MKTSLGLWLDSLTKLESSHDPGESGEGKGKGLSTYPRGRKRHWLEGEVVA